MSMLIATVLAAVPNVFLAIVGKLVTESFMQSVLEKVLIAGLEKASAMTTNTVDDEVVRDIAERLRGAK